MIRLLSLLTFACWAAAILLLVTDADSNAPPAIVLILVAVALSAILAVRGAYLKAKGFVSNVQGFLSGDYQQVRLVSVEDPKGWFSPESEVTMEFVGADGQTHSYQHGVPIPFFYAWGYRLGKRFKLPGLSRLDPTNLLATEFRREGLKLTVSRPTQAP